MPGPPDGRKAARDVDDQELRRAAEAPSRVIRAAIVALHAALLAALLVASPIACRTTAPTSDAAAPAASSAAASAVSSVPSASAAARAPSASASAQAPRKKSSPCADASDCSSGEICCLDGPDVLMRTSSCVTWTERSSCVGLEACRADGDACRTPGTRCIGGVCRVSAVQCKGPAGCGAGETCCQHFKVPDETWCAGKCTRQIVCVRDEDCPADPGNPVWKRRCEPPWNGGGQRECH
jgi:hypothetical protein